MRPIRWLLAVGCWLLAVGCWLLAVGCWLLAVPLYHKFSLLSSVFLQKNLFSAILDLFGNPVGYLTGQAISRAEALRNCIFGRKLFRKLPFPNNSIL
jgi:hypothetical protein